MMCIRTYARAINVCFIFHANLQKTVLDGIRDTYTKGALYDCKLLGSSDFKYSAISNGNTMDLYGIKDHKIFCSVLRISEKDRVTDSTVVFPSTALDLVERKNSAQSQSLKVNYSGDRLWPRKKKGGGGGGGR